MMHGAISSAFPAQIQQVLAVTDGLQEANYGWWE